MMMILLCQGINKGKVSEGRLYPDDQTTRGREKIPTHSFICDISAWTLNTRLCYAGY